MKILLITLALAGAACAGVTAGEVDDQAPRLAGGAAAIVAAPAPASTTTTSMADSAPSLEAPRGRAEPLQYRIVEPVIEPVPPRAGPLLPRDVTTQAYTPFATVGGVTLHHPSASVELIGFHESNHDGAQQMEPLDTAVAPFTMTSRGRGTGSRTAADIVVEPGVAIVSPVTGTVLRAGSYTLYCDYRDHYAVIEPDDQAGWEVKILHFLDLQVSAGDRVEGGITVLGSGPRPLAFRSQVDDATAAPSWPHVHVEVVDPSIPDRPSGISC